jgi:hypothetical protein
MNTDTYKTTYDAAQFADGASETLEALVDKFGGSWVYFDPRIPDRVVSSRWFEGRCIEQVLANGVRIRPREKH